MKERFKKIEEEIQKEVDSAVTLDELDALKIKYLGRKGIVSGLFKEMSGIPDDKKPDFGKDINRLKEILNCEFKQRSGEIFSKQKNRAAAGLDITMPGVKPAVGTLHPITKALKDICDIFYHMGFAVVEGPEIETEHNNFEALNIPLSHPSRDAFDTFYIKPGARTFGAAVKNGWLLRSHTSPVQIRYMLKNKPPFAIVVPGKVFRPDAVDASHSFMFHQVEGLVVSDDINFANLKWLLFEFVRQYFGAMSKVRFRPHFFPFTEPSAEVDVSCMICEGAGCSVCSRKGWLEILGAGMVNPRVFKAVGINPAKYNGLAFGMGVERIAMLKYGIDDIRLFFENDLRFLRQF